MLNLNAKAYWKTLLMVMSLLLVAAGVLVVNGKANIQHTNIDKIHFGLAYNQPISQFDPQAIQVVTEAELSYNLYARLFDYNDDGSLVGDLADEVIWKENELFITIKPNIKTVSGHTVGPPDVYHSLLRIINNTTATHGNLKSLLCPNAAGKDCPGLELDDNGVRFLAKNEQVKRFIVPVLSSIDHSIIPLTAFTNAHAGNYELKSWKETSGPFYVSSHASSSKIILTANPKSHKFYPKMPQSIEVVPEKFGKVLDLYRDNKVDLVSFTSGILREDLSALPESTRVLFTDEFKLKFLAFTAKGLKKFKESERINIGLKLKSSFFDAYGDRSWSKTNVVFPPSSFGQLTKEVSIFEEAGGKPHESVKIMTSSALVDDLQAKIGNDNNFKFQPLGSKPPWLLSENQQPDAYLLNIDSIFHEDISLLYYGFSINLFADKESAPSWFVKYMSLPTEERRLELESLHKSMILSGRIIPIGFAPYISVMNEKFEYKNNKDLPGTALWKIRKN